MNTDPQVHEDLAVLSDACRRILVKVDDLTQRLEAIENRFGSHTPSDATGEQPEATVKATAPIVVTPPTLTAKPSIQT